MSRTLITLGTIGLVGTLAGACDRDAPSYVPSSGPSRPAATSEAPRRTGEEAPTALNEAQSVEALGTLNHEEVELARYANERAQTNAARSFAQMMIDQHTQAEADIVAWAQTHEVAGEMNDVTPAVTTSAASVRARLEATPDADFDRTYTQSQIDMHEDALEILDQRILPGARDPGFRTLVTNIRGAVAQHLAHARTTLAELPHASSPVAASR